MNDIQMQSYRQCNPTMVKRARIDTNFGSQFDISAYHSPNFANNRQQWRRSSIAYFADGSPLKFDSNFDSNEIFHPENVLNANQQQKDHVNENSISPIAFPFSNYRNKVNAMPVVVSENEDESRVAAKTISMPPFCNNNLSPLPLASSAKQQQFNQYAMTPMMVESNDKKRKDMFPSQPAQPSKVRFRSHQAESWMEKYEELLDFRLNNGHCLVPNQYPANPSLAEWVKRQRYQYKLKGMGKHSSMSDDRVVALEKLGFVWNSHDAVWEERLKELKQYKSIFGNTNVPSKYEPNPQLAIWIKRQRRQYKFLTEGKPSTMTPYRVGKLREINFSWSGRKPKIAA